MVNLALWLLPHCCAEETVEKQLVRPTPGGPVYRSGPSVPTADLVLSEEHPLSLKVAKEQLEHVPQIETFKAGKTTPVEGGTGIPQRSSPRKDAKMADMMLQFQYDGGKPTLEKVRELFGLAAEEVDQGYGVTTTDPRAGMYVVLIKPCAEEKVRAKLAERAKKHPAEGIFGNPRVEPTGPPKSK